MRRLVVPLVHATLVSAIALAACEKTPGPRSRSEDVPVLSDASPHAETSRDATSSDASVAPASDASDATDASDARLTLAPYGTLKESARLGCAVLAKNKSPNYLANRDLKASFVDGNDLLALVNRSPQGALAPDYAPTDMVDVVRFEPKTAAECDRWQCLRKDAASAMKTLLAAMAKAGFPGHIESVYRSYSAQCVTFQGWVKRSDFCSAAEQSALPGHSQHQLGTTIDLFTQEWKAGGETVFRQGFGCTKGAKWLKEHSWEHGFVFPYPIHPDDLHEKEDCLSRGDHEVPINPKTGYRYEHWHVRYVGTENAKAFHEASSTKDARDPDSMTLEQWIRGKRGLPGDTDLSVCDGCNCGSCATLAGTEGVCGGRSISLADTGLPMDAEGIPKLVSVRLATAPEAGKWPGTVLAIEVDVPPRTLTQPPFVGVSGPGFGDTNVTSKAFVPLPQTKARDYPTLARAVRVGLRLATGEKDVYPYAFGIAEPQVGRIYNRANLLVPAQEGKKVYFVPMPKLTGDVEVRVSRGGVPIGEPLTFVSK